MDIKVSAGESPWRTKENQGEPKHTFTAF